MPIIETHNLSFWYAKSREPSLRGVELRIEKGEFVLLAGKSGSGKTTLCRCLNGLIPHFYQGTVEGEVLVDGLDPRQHPVHELATRVGLVLQNPDNQLFALTIEKDIAFGPENLGLIRQQITERLDWALEMMQIQHLRSRAPFELSGGEQQKAAIAGVLAMHPKILVLDEPLAFLDPNSGHTLIQTLSELRTRLDLTIILVEHRLDLVADVVDRMIVMENGNIQLDDKPEMVAAAADSFGVALPKVTLLFKHLAGRGFPVKELPLTVHGAATLLKRGKAN